MNCNKCGEEVFTIPSQYTKFCKDCGKIILKLDGINTPTSLKNTPPVNNNPTLFTAKYQHILEDKQQVTEYVPNTYTDDGTTSPLLIGALIIGIICIATIVYIGLSNSKKEESTTEEATEVTTEIVADSAVSIASVVTEETTHENDIITDIDGNDIVLLK